jgi:nicotinamide riboside transporter PnuC
VSTLSILTSFIPAYLTFRRSPYYALGYAFNDVVLVVLWIMASIDNTAYVSVAVCFIAFLANDLYGFFSWKKMSKRQGEKD